MIQIKNAHILFMFSNSAFQGGSGDKDIVLISHIFIKVVAAFWPRFPSGFFSSHASQMNSKHILHNGPWKYYVYPQSPMQYSYILPKVKSEAPNSWPTKTVLNFILPPLLWLNVRLIRDQTCQRRLGYFSMTLWMVTLPIPKF